jgi:hypothetical protein
MKNYHDMDYAMNAMNRLLRKSVMDGMRSHSFEGNYQLL